MTDDETPLQARRRRLGLSLRMLAEYTGINRGLLSLWEHGRYVPDAAQQLRLTAVLMDFEGVTGRGSAAFLTAEERIERADARRMVARAIRKGELVRGPCEVCGSPNTAAHHRNGYADPLRVVWLCGMHHGAEHHAQNDGRREAANVERTHARARVQREYRGA